MFLKIEAGLVVIALVLAFTVPRLGSRCFDAIEQSFGKLARRRGLSVVVVGLTALVLRLVLLPILPIPVPGGYDGFSYLLLADTFAHGRLANPTSPMWVHFETFYTLWKPTHVSMYFPAQGLFMAVGQVLLGNPYWGVWLSVGIMCAAITWMLQEWVGESWALLGGFLAVIRLGSFSYWANGYWGGAVAAIGGALVLGALPRMKREHRLGNALLMGVGFAILANSRPYEGLFFGIPIAGALLVWLWKLKRPELGGVLKRAVVPLLAVLALTVAAMGYYFWRTTGSPLTPPYLLATHQEEGSVPAFPWQGLQHEAVFRHAIFKKVYLNFALPRYKLGHTLSGFAAIKVVSFIKFWTFFLGPVFTFPLLLVWFALPYGFSFKQVSSRTRFLLLVCGITFAGEALPIWYNPHYSAPIVCAMLALILIALRFLRGWQWRGKAAGKFIARAVPSICVLLLAMRVAASPLHLPLPALWPTVGTPEWCSPEPMNWKRANVLRKLRRKHGRQLVIVHYSPQHDPYFEWVYNRADLNSAKVIWARDMGPEKNQELIDYFKGRHAWLVYADDKPPRLEPYSETRAASGASNPLGTRK